MTWEEMRVKYPEYRDEMSRERELQFVSDCFDCYEQEGFSNKFWSMGGDFPNQKGKHFTVVGRTTEYPSDKDGADLECLPMWNIRFDDGFEMAAYPDEIIPREMKSNGCPASFFI